MTAVTLDEVIERLSGIGNPKALDLIERIRVEGIAPLDGYVLVRAELFNSAIDCVGRFVGDEGWCSKDMETYDALLANTLKG